MKWFSTLTAALLVIAAIPFDATEKAAAEKTAANEDEAGFTSMFDGTSLQGWTQRNGTATYVVILDAIIEGGAIVGTTNEGSPNSFLCSDKQYGNFELRFEVKCDGRLNSGVQIRSSTKPNKDGTPNAKGRVNGPQVEIEGSPGQSGFIYGEATGLGWLSREPTNPDKSINTHTHFKNGEWNAYRVVAKGPRIQTWINGHKVADLTHEKIYESHPKGFIGLQVHSIKRKTGPYQVAWRNIRIKELD